MKYIAFTKGWQMCSHSTPDIAAAVEMARARARVFGSGFVATNVMVTRKVFTVFAGGKK